MLFSPLSLLYFLPILLLSLLRTFTRLRGIGRIYGRDLHPTFMTQRKIVQKFSPAGEHGVQERPERPPFPRLSSLFPAASFFSRTPSNAFTSSEMIYELFTSDRSVLYSSDLDASRGGAETGLHQVTSTSLWEISFKLYSLYFGAHSSFRIELRRDK